MNSLIVSHAVDIVLSTSSLAGQHSKFFEQMACAYFCGKSSIRNAGATASGQGHRSRDPDPTGAFACDPGSPIREILPDSFRAARSAPSSRCGPASRDRRPARPAPLLPMHQTDSSALRAQVKKRPARTSTQPPVGSARIMFGSASTKSGAPIWPSVLRPGAPDLAAGAQAAGLERADGRGRPVAVRRDLRGRRARVDVAGRERAARLRAPAPQAAVALARAGRRLRAADLNPVGVGADLHGRADLLRLRDALTELRFGVPPPAVERARASGCRTRVPGRWRRTSSRVRCPAASAPGDRRQGTCRRAPAAPPSCSPSTRRSRRPARAHVNSKPVRTSTAFAGSATWRGSGRDVRSPLPELAVGVAAPAPDAAVGWPARRCGGCRPRARSMDRPRRSPAPARCRHRPPRRRAGRRRRRPSSVSAPPATAQA